MVAPNPVPKYVYKIVPTAPPEPFPEAFPLSALDAKDGFIHLSTATQVPNTADLFFSTHTALWLIKFELANFADPIKWEDTFPHLYGNFGKKDVESMQKFERSEDKTWKQVMDGSSWLV